MPNDALYQQIYEQVKDIDTTDLSDDVPQGAVMEITEEQKIYFWTRIYLKDENPVVEIGDDITIEYTPTGEKLHTQFICYGKKGMEKDHDQEITNYDPEDDKKVICLMIDTKMVNLNDDIPFIRTLFKTGYHYEYQLVKREELLFVHDKSGTNLDYFDTDF